MIHRQFVPGSEWLYLKIYTGIKTADAILEEGIQPLVAYFQKEHFISQWFFIRYHDPKSHLRLRFRITDSRHYNEILNKLNTVLQDYINSGEIADIVIDVYKRELERYGQHTMESAEKLFCIHSEFTLRCLDYNDDEKIMVSLFYFDELLNTINISVQEKLNWAKDSNEAFKREFNADKRLNSQLDKKYREFKIKYLDFIRSEEFSEERNAIISNINECNEALQHVVLNLSDSLELSPQRFFQSIFHMHINRIFISNQRLFEMVIYDFLMRYYKTIAYHA
ncbi:thiopeptide-type bacteriocin biosynthesis protein [Chryseobacterium sp.]|uniref:thiopeptide-type bacteriocin biosynthesis protein n=1 Tax=Chryseobacterium sp. TaxID=1871047 RepID=UPI0025BE6E60|nr:thiopeptide-type bacteriocin biosynthesis protein [Chryseobacterium sp.]